MDRFGASASCAIVGLVKPDLSLRVNSLFDSLDAASSAVDTPGQGCQRSADSEPFNSFVNHEGNSR